LKYDLLTLKVTSVMLKVTMSNSLCSKKPCMDPKIVSLSL